MAGTARQVHLGRELKKLRTARGLSLDDVAAHLERSRSTVGHWESGHSRVGPNDLKAVLELYEADEELREQLLKLRRESGQRGWWHSYKLPAHLAPFVGFEAEASEVFHFELGLVPGLLQTKAYIEEINKVGRQTLADEQLAEAVEVRLRRQDRLHQDNGFSLHAVVAEEALHRVVGSPAVMREQIEHLIQVSKLPSVNLQVLPLSAGAHVGVHGPITVLRFPDPGHGDIAYSDTPLGGNVIDDLRDVTELGRLFSALQAQALPAAKSVKYMGSILGAHGRSKE